MKPYKFHPAARAEMNDAAAYYDSQQENLGRRFLVSVQDAINKIRINPQLYPATGFDARRCLTKTFPFGIIFRDMPERIVIVAVMHLHREPDYWATR